ncbi:unnamed protein product [Symbiodinium sp. KB8]|nr:unnamed protein product [Symbiodinium sp. KB8]
MDGFHAAAVASQELLEKPLLPARYEDRISWRDFRGAERLVARCRREAARVPDAKRLLRRSQSATERAKRKEERAGYDVSNPAAFWLGTSQGTAGTVLPPPPPPAPPPPPPAPLPQAPVPQAPPQAPPPPPLT